MKCKIKIISAIAKEGSDGCPSWSVVPTNSLPNALKTGALTPADPRTPLLRGPKCSSCLPWFPCSSVAKVLHKEVVLFFYSTQPDKTPVNQHVDDNVQWIKGSAVQPNLTYLTHERERKRVMRLFKMAPNAIKQKNPKTQPACIRQMIANKSTREKMR